MVNEKTEVVQDILKAAKKRLINYGLDKTTMNEIADDIGMSKASLYYYFTNKEDLFRAVIQHEHDHFIQQQVVHLPQVEDCCQLLFDYADDRLSFFQDFLNLNKLSLGSINKSKPAISRLFATFRDHEILHIERILRKGVANHSFTSIDIPAYAELFISVLQGLRRNIILKKDLIDISQEDYRLLREQYQLLVQLFCKGIKHES